MDKLNVTHDLYSLSIGYETERLNLTKWWSMAQMHK